MYRIVDFFNKNFIFKSKEKLSVVTIFFITVLNILILVSLYIGSGFYKNMVNHPSSVFPRLCQNIISSKDIYNTSNYFYQYENFNSMRKDSTIDSRCNELIYSKLNALQSDLYIKSLIKLDDDYNKNFDSSILVNDFVNYIEQNKKQIQNDYISLDKLYKLKLESIYLLFKIPLFFILFYMMKKQLQRRNYTLFITFKSVFYAVFITIIISLYTMISNLVPEGLINKIIKSSYEAETHVILYYLLMVVLLFVFGFIIERYQSKYRNKSKNYKSNNISRVVLHKCEDKLK